MTRRLLILLFLLVPISLCSQNPDIRILRSINSSQSVPSDKFFQLVSNSNIYIVIGIPAGVAATGLIKHDERLFRNACVILAASTLNFAVTTAMKYSFNRDRPFVTYPEITKKSSGGGPSFPSGHTSSAFATATSVSLAYPKWYIIVPSYTWASAVGYSRMHLGVHYPSDVLVGALVGSGSAWLSYAINKKLNKNSRKKPCNCP